MTLQAIFKKDVNRPIEGVIKADDDASLRIEVEEYVITNEVEKRLEIFLDAYNNYSGANGVWVSGFFGSGKSHLLKMLAILLENRHIDGASTLEMFLPKCGNNEILRGDIKRAVSIPSQSILFNIDQKADVISKTETDALLSVFVKVFDEMSGYFGKHGHIAQFERDLDSRGLYQDFKAAYEQISGRSWVMGREQALFESANIAKAYAEVTGDLASTAEGILDKYRSEYSVSIEDFAANVNAFIASQEDGFRLNFFVDEVGQYIAENIKLMTNLQTIAESLATKCKGQAWVVVTAQEDMQNVVGDMTKQQANDFSKIQARFANRMKLTSADVSEVVQKRLLMKNDDGIAQLSDIFHDQSNNFKTLFDFADGSKAYKNFQDRDHFIHCYPFIPYQFDLFQTAIEQLSNHNAFEGKHSSVGERSMLGVFQQVAIQISNHNMGQLATFDLMFEGIRTALKSSIQRAVILAEKNLENKFAIRLLKALFLVKYLKDFKPTIRNLSVLMLDEFTQDITGLRNTIEESLDLLEQQTYIQRNGELYEYLTDEEKDVEEEIKNTEVDSSDVATELNKLIFERVIRQTKIRYDENNHDYPFTKKLDDRLYGREHELTIHVISPFNENVENIPILQSQSLGKEELLVVLPADARLLTDLLMYKRTEKYVRQNMSVTQQEAVKRILTDKGHQNNGRFSELQQHVGALISKAKIFVSGTDIDAGREDPQTRVIKGFYGLISRTYPNLKMLRGVAYTESKVGEILKQAQEGLFGNDATSMTEAEQEVLTAIQSNSRGGIRTTTKSLLEKFERKPYGWSYAAILCNLTYLCARGKIEVRSDGNLLDDADLTKALMNSREHGNLVLDPQVDFTASQVRKLKDFYTDFFDLQPKGQEAKVLGKDCGIAFHETINTLKPLYSQAGQYPFLNALKPVLDTLQDVSDKPYQWYLTELPGMEDKLLGMKEDVIDPIRKFMGGSLKQIFQEAQLFLTEQKANFDYIDGDEASEISDILSSVDCYKGGNMQRAKTITASLGEKIQTCIKQEIESANDQLAELKGRIEHNADFSSLPEDDQKDILVEFDNAERDIAEKTLIAAIRDAIRRLEEQTYPRLLAKITDALKPVPASSNPTNVGGLAEAPASELQPQKEVISSKSIRVSYGKPWLTDESDLDDYMKAVREAFLSEIKSGKRVQV